MEEGLESNFYAADLTPGFRFAPTEEELITFYLHNKLEDKRPDLQRVMDRLIPVLDIYEFNPWDLPRFSGDLNDRYTKQWFFLVPRQENEARGGKPRRLTTTGYWKGTGSPGYVYSSDSLIIGVKRSMVFYVGRAPNGKKTEWKLHEYKAIIQEEASSSTTTTAHPMLRHEFSLCRLYLQKSKYQSSFDRRPIRGDQMANLSNVQPAHSDNDTTRTSLQVPSIVDDPKTNSSERLSLAENKNLSFQTGESISTTMALADEPIWDWEQLENWFYCEQDATHSSSNSWLVAND